MVSRRGWGSDGLQDIESSGFRRFSVTSRRGCRAFHWRRRLTSPAPTRRHPYCGNTHHSITWLGATTEQHSTLFLSRRTAMRENIDFLNRIKQLAIVAMFSDDELMEKLVLKGGNLLDVVYQISARSSVDVDFSMEGEFPSDVELRDRIASALSLRTRP